MITGNIDMKALLGPLAKKIKSDPKGKEELSGFIASGLKEQSITLSNGKKYRISTSPLSRT